MDLSKKIRVVEGFPNPSISFKDVSPLLADPIAFRACIDECAAAMAEWNANLILGPESRGFLFGAPLALATNCGFVMARKAGKLPGETYKKSYTLEYGTATLEIPKIALCPGDRVVLIDDLLATGGTLLALKEIVEEAGAKVVGILTIIELTDLKGREIFGDTPFVSLIKYPH